MRLLWVVLLITPAMAAAQTRLQHENAMRFGEIATVTPLCGLRDLSWSADLQRAELRAMGLRPDGSDQSQGPQWDRAEALLSYAQSEALEAFADRAPEATCGKLVLNPDLEQADAMVDAFRAGADQPMW